MSDDKEEIAENTHAGRALIAIKDMRSRKNLAILIHAAEARDSHLAKLEAADRAKRLWAKFSHIKVGDTVFTHKDAEGKYTGLNGSGLRVRQVKPRVKEIVVTPLRGSANYTLTVHMLDTWKVSLEPTAKAFDNALVGDISQRRAR
jgi:hypothetical protein